MQINLKLRGSTGRYIMNTEEIGLEQKNTKPIIDQLDGLLANYHLYYQKLRVCHWDVIGTNFFALHIKTNEVNAMRTIDELTERIFSLEKTPLSTYQEYINSSVIREVQKYFGDIDLLKYILCDFETLIAFERGIA